MAPSVVYTVLYCVNTLINVYTSITGNVGVANCLCHKQKYCHAAVICLVPATEKSWYCELYSPTDISGLVVFRKN